jgi:2-desacetyl-2-hydroxyethyl bacteriochlorophyllide A dehydrogenase
MTLRVLQISQPGKVEIVQDYEPDLTTGQVRIRTLFSGISAGTELTSYRGSNPYLSKRWDPGSRLFIPGAPTKEYPLKAPGYEEVGVVVELAPGVTNLSVGDIVWGTWGHTSATTLDGSHAAARVLSPGVAPILGIFSQIGAIALNVVLDADIHVGETVAVFGMGVPGQIVAQLARLNGAQVIAVDRIPSRLDIARRLGADEVIDAREGDVAERIRALTDGLGADVSLEVSGAYQALHEAIRSTAYSSRVVAAGFFQSEGAGLALGEEFHHNRVQVICSQISGVAPALSYRWNTHRLQKTFMTLAETGRVELKPLISAIVPLDDAAEAFERLNSRPEEALQVVLRFLDTAEGS